MMNIINIDSSAIGAAALGAAASATLIFWQRKVEVEHRCEFLRYVNNDLNLAFRNADAVLESDATPPMIRKALLALLAAYANEIKTKEFKASFVKSASERDSDKGKGENGPFAKAMNDMSQKYPDLARKTHHVFASLYLGLVVLNFSDEMKIEKVQDEVARDPSTLWSWIGRMFKNHDDDGTGVGKHGILHV